MFIYILSKPFFSDGSCKSLAPMSKERQKCDKCTSSQMLPSIQITTHPAVKCDIPELLMTPHWQWTCPGHTAWTSCSACRLCEVTCWLRSGSNWGVKPGPRCRRFNGWTGGMLTARCSFFTTSLPTFDRELMPVSTICPYGLYMLDSIYSLNLL